MTSVIALLVAVLFIKTWAVTLLVGALHSQVPEVPPVGWEAASIVVLLGLALTYKVEVES